MWWFDLETTIGDGCMACRRSRQRWVDGNKAQKIRSWAPALCHIMFQLALEKSPLFHTSDILSSKNQHSETRLWKTSVTSLLKLVPYIKGAARFFQCFFRYWCSLSIFSTWHHYWLWQGILTHLLSSLSITISLPTNSPSERASCDSALFQSSI